MAASWVTANGVLDFRSEAILLKDDFGGSPSNIGSRQAPTTHVTVTDASARAYESGSQLAVAEALMA